MLLLCYAMQTAQNRRVNMTNPLLYTGADKRTVWPLSLCLCIKQYIKVLFCYKNRYPQTKIFIYAYIWQMNVILLFKNIHLCNINDCGINQDVRYKLDISSPQISNPQAEWDIKPQLWKPVVVDPLSVVIRCRKYSPSRWLQLMFREG